MTFCLDSSLAQLRDPKVLGRHAGITVGRDGKPQQLSAENLVASIQPRIKVTPESRFTGFDAYQKLVKSEVDLVMLTTPPGYRPIHFEAAVEAGKHVFAEKPIATDATATGTRSSGSAATRSWSSTSTTSTSSTG
jgi:hypothetical protein